MRRKSRGDWGPGRDGRDHGEGPREGVVPDVPLGGLGMVGLGRHGRRPDAGIEVGGLLPSVQLLLLWADDGGRGGGSRGGVGRGGSLRLRQRQLLLPPP